MIDLHTHTLPDIDDGAKDASVSLKMLSDSYSQGTSVCVATPHIIVHEESEIDEFLSKRALSVHALKTELNKTPLKIPKLFFGAEVLLDNDVSEFKSINKLCIQNTNLMLVELPMRSYSKNYSEWLYSLSVKGIDLILAHIERYPFFDRLHYELEGTNITYQINADTLLSISGRSIAKRLYQSGNRIVVSSDAHGITYRKNHMREAYEKIEKRSKDMADDLFNNYAARLLVDSMKSKHTTA